MPDVIWKSHSRDIVKHSTPNHKIRTYRKNYAVFSVLEVVFNDEEVQRASYRCIGNNSIGATSDSVEIHLLERTNEVQVANTYSERRTEVEIFQYNDDPYEEDFTTEASSIETTLRSWRTSTASRQRPSDTGRSPSTFSSSPTLSRSLSPHRIMLVISVAHFR